MDQDWSTCCKPATVLQKTGPRKKSNSSWETFRAACAWRPDRHGMKPVLVLTLLFTTAVLRVGAAGDAKVTFIAHDKVAKGGTLVTAPDLIVMVVSRDRPGEV